MATSIPEKSILDFLKLSALPTVAAVFWAIYFQYNPAAPLWGGPLSVIVALFLQYGYRRTHVKKGFIDELMGNISSFEKIAQNFRALYQNFEVSPLQWLRPSLENKNSLISERWLTLLKRIIEARRDDATDTQIASFTREFLKILADYRDLIVLPLVERANSAIQVTKGTKIKYAKFRADYNHLVDGTNGLVGRLNSELSLAKNPVKESAERIIEDLEVIET